MRIGWLVWTVLLLGGCSNLDSVSQVSDPQSVWARQLAWLKGLQQWRASGRVAVRSASDGESASLLWRQGPAAYSLRLHGPFGQGAVLIEGKPDSVTLRRADGKVSHAANAQELLRRELGWSLPVSVLRYWILGRPASGFRIDEFRLNAAGLLGRLSQAGWQVRYLGYREVDQGVLPAKIELRRADVRVRVVLSQWQIPG